MKKIVVFYGYKGSGKDTCCEILESQTNETVRKFSFAEALRVITWDLFGNRLKDKERLYGAIDKKEEPIEGWIIPEDIKEQCGFTEDVWTGRRLLQWLGTDVCRKVYNNIWTDKLVNSIEASLNQFDIAVVTDCRFKNEYEVLANLKDKFDVQFIYVNRFKEDNAFSSHSSEKDMVDFEYDITIENTGSIDDLKDKVKSLKI